MWSLNNISLIGLLITLPYIKLCPEIPSMVGNLTEGTYISRAYLTSNSVEVNRPCTTFLIMPYFFVVTTKSRTDVSGLGNSTLDIKACFTNNNTLLYFYCSKTKSPPNYEFIVATKNGSDIMFDPRFSYWRSFLKSFGIDRDWKRYTTICDSEERKHRIDWVAIGFLILFILLYLCVVFL